MNCLTVGGVGRAAQKLFFQMSSVLDHQETLDTFEIKYFETKFNKICERSTRN